MSSLSFLFWSLSSRISFERALVAGLGIPQLALKESTMGDSRD